MKKHVVGETHLLEEITIFQMIHFILIDIKLMETNADMD